jgi:hypothetical protein
MVPREPLGLDRSANDVPTITARPNGR